MSTLKMSSSQAANRTVRRVRVVMHTTGPMAPGSLASENHSSLYCLLDEGQSYQFNMYAQGNDPTGRLYHGRRDYQLSHSAITFFDYSVIVAFTPRNVHELLADQGLLAYTFRDGLMGYRHWM